MQPEAGARAERARRIGQESDVGAQHSRGTPPVSLYEDRTPLYLIELHACKRDRRPVAGLHLLHCAPVSLKAADSNAFATRQKTKRGIARDGAGPDRAGDD